MITCNNITSGYGKAMILKQFSVDFAPHKFTALIGENGCGKSTLMKAIMGFLPIAGGEVTWNHRGENINLHKISPKQRAKLVAYLPQHTYCPDYLTVAELVELGRYAYGNAMFGQVSREDKQRFMACLDQVGLADMASSPVNALSGGQRQRAWIAMILAQDSHIILLDEPVNHLDVRYQYSVLALVREIMADTQKTIVAVLHDLNQASVFSDQVCLLKNGAKIAHGDTADIMIPANIKQGFDFDSTLVWQNNSIFCIPDISAYQQVLPKRQV